MDRRAAIGLTAGAVVSLAAGAGLTESGGLKRADAGPEIVPLWPGIPPGGSGVHPTLTIEDRENLFSATRDRIAMGIAAPTLTVFRPQAPNGAALLIVPGGGYSRILIDKEGGDIAERFDLSGVTGFVLTYRLPSEGWADGPDVPLQDAQRAMRLIRANAARFGIDRGRVGVIGFSAGGHLAASLATRHGARVSAPIDPTDHEDASPSFAALIYPVITMLAPFAHEASRERLLGEHPTTAERAAYSCERLVNADTPPSFLVAAADDPDVPIENTLSMFASLRAAHVPAEMHIFEEGGHGFGLRGAQGKPVSAWPDLLLRWLGRHGYVH